MQDQSITVMDIAIDDEQKGEGSTSSGTEQGDPSKSQSNPGRDDSEIEGQVGSCEGVVVHGDTHKHGSRKADNVEMKSHGTTVDAEPSPSIMEEDGEGGCSGRESSAGMRSSQTSVRGWQYRGKDQVGEGITPTSGVETMLRVEDDLSPSIMEGDSDRRCSGRESSTGMRLSETSIRSGQHRGGKDQVGEGVTPTSGIDAILRVEDDLRKEKENKEALVDALLVQEILSSVVHYFGTLLSDEEKQNIIDLIIEAIMDCDLNYGEKAAIQWGDGFKWKKETLDKDLELFMESGMDIKVMAASRLASLKHDRLNPQRVESLRADNPERERLLGLCEGMVVPKPEGFVPNGATSTKGLHKVYKRVHAAVDRMLSDIHDQQLGFVLPEGLTRQHIIHNRMLSKWAPKKKKPSGRNIGDLSYCEGPHFLNGKWAKDEAARIWGPIEHPTIDDIAVMILDFWDEMSRNDPGTVWSDLVMWKMDLKGAYTLMDVRPEEAGMFAQELVDDLIFFHLCGVFGWSCTPAAFQVITRAIVWELRHKLRGRAKMYVDDLFGISLRTNLEYDMACARKAVTDLLGSKSLAEDKEEQGTRLDIIGWVIDLDLCRLSIARKNLLKAFYGFFVLDLEAKTNLEEVERIASYSQRYSLVCRVMLPFQACFNRMIATHWNGHDRFHWTEEAKLAIRMWRGALYLVSSDETRYTKPLWSFRPQATHYIIETDGSLSEVGFILFELTDGGEVCLGGGAADLTPFGFGKDSSWQNTAEFIGAVVGIIALARLGVNGEGVKLRGDSKTALKWGREEKVAGAEAINAAIVMSTVCVKFGIEINESEFLAGVLNWKADDLSRCLQKGKSVREVMIEIGYGDKPILDLSEDTAAMRLLAACQPGLGVASEAEFIEMWNEIRNASNELRVN
jgi:hypothetical protein